MQPVASQPQMMSLRAAAQDGDAAPAHSKQSAGASHVVSIASNDAAAREMFSEWRDLRAAHGIDSPDADPEFFLGVYRELGESVSPYIAQFRREDAACGLIVARTSEQRLAIRVGSIRLRMPRLRCLEIVFGGLISNGAEHLNRAIIDHLQELFDSRAVDLVEIHHLETSHDLLNLIKQHRPWPRAMFSHEAHHIVRLLDENGAAIQRHSSKTRNTFRREDKKLASQFHGALVLEILTQPQTASEFIRQASQINQSSYHRALNVGVCDDNRWRAIVGALASSGALRGYMLRGAGKPIAYMLGAVYGRRCTFMATGYSHELHPFSPGKVMMNRVLEALATEGVEIADFGWGDAAYKTMFASERLDEVTIQIYGNALRARVAFAMHRMAAGMTRRAKAIAGARVVASLRRRWRERLREQAKPEERQGEAL